MNGDVDDGLIDTLANITVIGSETNRTSVRIPVSYIAINNITDEKLEQQFIDPSTLSISHEVDENWLRQRAHRLDNVGNEFLAGLEPDEQGESSVT